MAQVSIKVYFTNEFEEYVGEENLQAEVGTPKSILLILHIVDQ